MELLSLPVFPSQICPFRLLLVFTLSMPSLFYSSCGDPCPPFSCGHRNFGYPFSQKESGCGEPALQLQCDNNMPMLRISGNEYYILQPLSHGKGDSNLNPSMTIIDKNIWGDKCSPSNNTAQFWSFNYRNQFHVTEEYTNATLWTECTDEIEQLPDELVPTKLGCNSVWYYFSNSKLGMEYCKSLIQLPVRKSELPSLQSNLDGILTKGFEIQWELSPHCEDCTSRKEYCFYHTSNSTFSQCNTNIGCFVGGFALAAIVLLLLIFYVKKRKSYFNSGLSGYYQRSDMEARLAGDIRGNLSIFRYDELEQATNFFHDNNELGVGAFGSVFLGKLKDGRAVAIKRLYQENSRRVEQFMNEIQILSSLYHPNLVCLEGCTGPQSPVLLLVYEFVPNGTLADHLHGSRRTPKGLAWEIRLDIAIETAQALAFLHSVDPPIFHRDVKSTNILLDENFRAKLADFGLSRLVPLNVSHVTTAPQGTVGYVDPEYHQCFQLTDKSDVYSFGVVLVEIISAKVAVDVNRNRNEISLANMALDKIRRGALHELVDPDLKSETNHEVKAMVTAVAELAYQCLARERDCRPDMKEVSARLESIKQLYESSAREQQKSMRKESSDLQGVVPSLSPTSVIEQWPGTALDKSV